MSSKKKKEIEKRLAEIEWEKKMLKGLLEYYRDSSMTFNDVIEITGSTLSEFRRYQRKNDFPASRMLMKLDEVEEKIDNRIKELERESTNISPSLLGSLNNLLFIPSWSRLLGTKFRGFYLNHPVHEVIQDNVIFLPDMALTGFEETLGEPFFLILGAGVYYVKFGLSPGEIITDYKEITGIVLPLDIYEKAQDVSGNLVASKKLLMTETLVSIPFSIILARQTTQMYLRGVIARNVILPAKECFELLLKVCKDENTFKKEEGLKILSGGLSTKSQLFTNEILTEKELPKYSSMTAGIKYIHPKLEKIIADLQIDEEMKKDIFNKINIMKKDFVEMGYPGLVDWVP